MEIGGGFGGKTLVYLEPVAALLSRKTGQPVKLSMSRTEVFEGSGPTSGSYMRVKMGATKDGRITAAEAYLAYEAGAFPGSPVNPGCQCIFGPYDIPNSRIEGYDVVLNKPKTAAYRAPGAPAAAFAAETVIDEVCEKIGMDPLEFRSLNGAKEGTRRVTGPMFPRIGNLEMIQAAKEHEHYSAPLEGPNRGTGRRQRLLVQQCGSLQRHGQRKLRRDRQPRRRLGGHRRLQGGRGYARCGSGWASPPKTSSHWSETPTWWATPP